eukprot:g8482.t1
MLLSLAITLLVCLQISRCFLVPFPRRRRGSISTHAIGERGEQQEPKWTVPAKVKSLPGQKARQLLLENPFLFQVDKDQPDKENPDEAMWDAQSKNLGVCNLLQDFAASLRRRIEEVQESERGRALSELLYLMVCDERGTHSTEVFQSGTNRPEAPTIGLHLGQPFGGRRSS